MHHELSYTTLVPQLMIFVCVQLPPQGGAICLADSRELLRSLPRALVDDFVRNGWQLVRHYNELVGVSWPDAFGSEIKAEVEEYCHRNSIDFRWDSAGDLHTCQRRPAIVRHPFTDERCWFNQIAFFSEWTIDPVSRDWLISVFGETELPIRTQFGDGRSIGKEIVDLLNDTYQERTVRLPWRPGDLLVIDNILFAHSRDPYEGVRQVTVAMSDPVRLAGIDSSSVTWVNGDRC
jgi:alpha-ketoglutarate-dependent taurine dioxygenase